MSAREQKAFNFEHLAENLNAMRVIAALCAEIASAHVARAWPGLVVSAGAHVVAGLLKVRSWFVSAKPARRPDWNSRDRARAHASLAFNHAFESLSLWTDSVLDVFRGFASRNARDLESDWTDADEFAEALLSLRVALQVARASQSKGTEYVLLILDGWEERNRRVLHLARAWGSENLAESHEHKTADNQEASAQNQSSSDEETDCS